MAQPYRALELQASGWVLRFRGAIKGPRKSKIAYDHILVYMIVYFSIL